MTVERRSTLQAKKTFHVQIHSQLIAVTVMTSLQYSMSQNGAWSSKTVERTSIIIITIIITAVTTAHQRHT
jgi:membrane protein DedA with SNARE-associated domain